MHSFECNCFSCELNITTVLSSFLSCLSVPPSFQRRSIERLARKAKQDDEEKEEGAPAAGGEGSTSAAEAATASTETKLSPPVALGKKGGNPKKKAGNAKQD